eukprot:CAMPEP_0170414338 /NCGR_PEP_ID=MMETSP0117_2-20130122/32011_1 /TAXON_ID=400756 /ORGANISM="Durinskia baltica, Strain CSIRO CS-38" /LENGTH=650 /DNA_ID=CAMNT_0010672213 /DNA_START=72 /DNA_END=2024 /DNA_ORIENTATION=-
MASFLPADLPRTQLLVRSRDAVSVYDGPVKIDETAGTVKLNPVDLYTSVNNLRISPKYSPDGNLVCFVYEANKPISLCSTATGVELVSVDTCDAEYIEFSPRGTYIMTWSRPSKGSSAASTDIGNMKIWSTTTGVLVSSFSQKIYKTQVVQWTAEEEFCFRLVSNEVQIFNNTAMTSPIDKVYHKGLTQFLVTPTKSPYVSIAVFNPEAGGKPARVTLYRYTPAAEVDDYSTSESAGTTSTKTTRVEGPVSSRTIFAASEAQLTWNATGTALLVYAHADLDATSYYGATGLFLLQAHSDAAIKVEQSKDGPVHDVQWSPEGDKFVIAAGTMPCHCTLMDSTGSPLYQYGAAHRNTISWSPHGRFLCLAGFGNLAGEMDFYDTLRSKKIGSTSSHCSTYHAWSPDSRYFMTASLAPRMNVDNNLKIFKYNGAGPVVTVPFERAYDVRWRPASSKSVYPNRGPSPKRGGGDGGGSEGETATPTAKPTIAAAQPYRPPGSTGALARMMNKEVAPVGKVPKAAPAAKFVPTVQRQRIIPGMAPAATATAAAPVSKRSTAGAAAGNGKKPATPAPALAAPAPAKAKTTATATATATAVVETTESKEKRAKNINKKLKAIQEIRAKQSSGQTLEPEQVLKLNSEPELLAELKSLNI